MKKFDKFGDLPCNITTACITPTSSITQGVLDKAVNLLKESNKTRFPTRVSFHSKREIERLSQKLSESDNSCRSLLDSIYGMRCVINEKVSPGSAEFSDKDGIIKIVPFIF